MDGKKVLVWLGVVAVLFLCFVGSCVVMSASLSNEGRGFFRGMRHKADDVGRGEGERPEGVNASYNLTFNDDGTATFAGGGFTFALPKGYKVAFPEKAGGEAPRFEYYFTGAAGRVQVRLRREPGAGYDGWNYAGERNALFKHAEEYGKEAAGEGALSARPLAAVAPSALEAVGADNGVEGCYAFTPEQKKRQRYEGEYFLFLGRGYENVVLFSVAFRPFNRDAALVEGRKLAASLTFN